MRSATCKICGEPIHWGMKPRGRWVALDVDDTGTLVLLNDRYIVDAGFDEVPAIDLARMDEATAAAWRVALSGHRYRLHPKVCQQLHAMRLKTSDGGM